MMPLSMRKQKNFVYIIWKEGRHFVSQCLNVDVSSFGKTKAEAMRNLEEALELFLEDAPERIAEVRSPVVVERTLQYA